MFFSFHSIVLVENIPEELDLSPVGAGTLPLTLGLHGLLDMAKRSVEIVSPRWALTSRDQQTAHFSASEVQDTHMPFPHPSKTSWSSSWILKEAVSPFCAAR